MARFDVFLAPRGDDLLLDCQADTLDDLPTRFVVPLVLAERLGRPYARLNPVFEIIGERYVMGTQMALTVPVSVLKLPVTNLATEQFAIMIALDMLLTGY